MVKRKLVLSCLAGTMTFGLLAGCGDSAQEIKGLKEQIEALEFQNQSLTNKVNGMEVTELTPETSLYVVEGETVPSFQKIEGKIKFPNKLELPNSVDDVNNSHVMVGSKFKYTPSNNWILKMDGANMELSHPSKIWGSIKGVAVSDTVSEESMREVLKTFYKGFPKTTISYRKMFMDDRVTGMLSNATIKVDKVDYRVSVGFVAKGDYGQLLMFAYQDNKSGVQQELIDLFITSMTSGDYKLTME